MHFARYHVFEEVIVKFKFRINYEDQSDDKRSDFISIVIIYYLISNIRHCTSSKSAFV